MQNSVFVILMVCTEMYCNQTCSFDIPLLDYSLTLFETLDASKEDHLLV